MNEILNSTFWQIILIILVIVASLSPMLTFTRLFQLKEWRWDRLKEHLKQKGMWMQLIGKSRSIPFILYGVFCIIALIALQFSKDYIQAFAIGGSLIIIEAGCLMVLTALSCLQFLLKKQHMPVWTMKVRLIMPVAILLIVLTASLPMMSLFFQPFLTQKILSIALLLTLPFIVILSPLWVLIAWFLLLPLDRFLKHRTFQRAQLIREKLHNPIVIGIAGSVGKTTVKELLATVLTDLHPLTTPKHVNTEMGVSQWLLKQNQNSKFYIQNSPIFIIEMGAYRKGEIALLSSIVQPTIGVVTALGSDHLALFGSEEAIIEANGELIDALPANGHAFLYGDNPGTRSLAQQSPCPVTLVGLQPHNDVQANAIAETEQALSLEARTRNNEITMSSITVPLHGTHNIGNILLAIAVARHLGIDDDRIQELLASHRPLRTTFHVRREHGILLLNDTYNISPLSLRAAIEWAGNQLERPRILLTSGLLEIGPAEDRFHEELGALAQGKLERVIFTTDHGRAAFAKGYGDTVELLTDTTPPAAAGSALLCVGRMSHAAAHGLLPLEQETNNERTN